MAPLVNDSSFTSKDEWDTQDATDRAIMDQTSTSNVWFNDSLPFWYNCSDSSGCNSTNCSSSLNCTIETVTECDPTSGTCGVNNGNNLTEFHIIKAVVLVAVTSVLLLSVCRMVLQLFVRYTNVKHPDK